MNAGLLAKAAAHAMFCVHFWRFVKTKLHGLSGKRACPVAYSASTTGKRVAHFFGHHCSPHSNGFATVLGWLKAAQGARGTYLRAGHAKNACLSSCRYDGRGQFPQAFFKPGETDAFVWANVRALTTTNAGFQEILFRLGSRGAQIAAQPCGSWQAIGKQK